MHSEFELIARYFTPAPPGPEAGVALGVGDDCTLLAPTPGRRLAVSVDTSVAGVHFPDEAPAEAIGHRALAVSLSDLAAMGARARWCLMALTLAEADDAWLEGFSRGFRALCEASGTALVGGDVTRGATAIGVTVMGEVDPRVALTRGGARAGDLIAVTGTLGGGAGGLALWQRGERDPAHPLLVRYLRPLPRLAAGEALLGLATAAIDVSDGLLADLGHVLEASGVGAELDRDALPLAEGLVAALGEEPARQAALGGGDDYELLLTLPAERLDEARGRLAALDLPLTAIGRITEAPGVVGVEAGALGGWQHFQGLPDRGGQP
ncbi:thiamine-phosphate kinase [Halomonas heilongjiangensis]|uniref:Thiamine-monophosphate kinase n=1 Tax=Halomonas heilongjiangensis TaxID=1387883 RepID=A0A2N7TN45_9GAMM|nr:thiamine-phosphate kinase [Halomonas heilongjiangensis]PMR69606.1 thiamine-phosphate kinase [Halomonas heilongjiangensis]PXX86941.1 thiamine-phosphate kinase [Halomonas heilongjiangensis]